MMKNKEAEVRAMPENNLERKEREHQEDLAKLRGLRPIDDDFYALYLPG